MPPRKTTPTTFDGWLGKIIDDETNTIGGRAAVASWIGISEQSVNRRARGEVPYLAREVQIIAHRANFKVSDVVARALTKYGGIEKLLAEYAPVSEPTSTVEDIASRRASKQPLGDDWYDRSAAIIDPELEQDEP